MEALIAIIGFGFVTTGAFVLVKASRGRRAENSSQPPSLKAIEYFVRLSGGTPHAMAAIVIIAGLFLIMAGFGVF